MMADEIEYSTTVGHLRRFEEAAQHLEARLAAAPSKLAELELAAVRALADDLRVEVETYVRRRTERRVQAGGPMRITVNVDAEVSAAAAAVLGTSTKVDTVNRALAEVAARPRRVAAVERLRTAADDLGDAETMQRAWR